MLHNSIAWLLTTNQWLAKYHVTWIWIQFTLVYIQCTLQNKLGLGKPNASVILTVNKYITQG